MNDFKLYQKYKNENINYKIILVTENAIEFIMSYPTDIWRLNDCDTKCYKKITITRTDWAEIKNYSNHMDAITDFKNAIEEFQSDIPLSDYSNEVNLYFLNKANSIIDNLEKQN